MIIGITGKSGSGKTTISNELNRDGKYVVLDVDRIVHAILKDSTVKQDLVNKYGEEILINNQIDRKKLGNIVFASNKNIEEYNQYIWEHVKKQLERDIESANKNIIIEWGLLPLTEYLEKCDIKVLVQKDLATRMKRTMKRDRITEEYFLKRDSKSLEYNPNDYDIVILDDDISKIEKLLESRKKI